MTMLSISEAVAQLRASKVVACPTESVYGLGCDPFDRNAFDRLLALKQRPLEKGVILIAANADQVEGLTCLFDQAWSKTVLQSWERRLEPGESATTWILPARDSVPDWVTGGRDTLAVRVSQHPVVKALCEAYGGALVSTSANLSGQPPIRERSELTQTFPEVDVVEGALGQSEQPSQILCAQTGKQLR
ncbi:Sua5/YciO/YrdC/YwlC family protein [Thiomicrospira sp. WB1]|uniref:Sua5/YciO/YrdC/YwlC family protein n=1 Tax=Thiomicrospira sp. WB1 TaxID=1685380 RepID=UPI000747BDAF|nr:Sua5/YciO/YrdC/YwlC family protein [Thiomicrospira sp. WB1]KUJ72323.1 tRNA threonylcarbamoyladenosine biosynthesis protein RimN [Thiomicrospira sp. WB1]